MMEDNAERKAGLINPYGKDILNVFCMRKGSPPVDNAIIFSFFKLNCLNIFRI